MILLFLSFCFWPLKINPTLGETKLTPTRPKHALQISIEDIKEQEGNLLVSIYNSAKALDIANPGGALANFIVPARGKSQQVELLIEEGTYAVLVAHDLNGNYKVDKNWMGVPTEPIGISNRFKSKLRKPTFAECAFRFQYSGQCVPIVLEKF